jgi:hypothetical protein
MQVPIFIFSFCGMLCSEKSLRYVGNINNIYIKKTLNAKWVPGLPNVGTVQAAPCPKCPLKKTG